MQAKRWIIQSLSIIILLLVTVTILMVWTDTYSIVHTNRKLYSCEPNRNYLKVEYILSHPNKYDSFIFGSSKVGAINPSSIASGHFYNMTYSKGIPHEHLLNLKLFLNSGISIKQLLIGVEEMSYQDPFPPRQHQGITKAHPMATGESWLEYYFFYFFRFPDKLDRSKFIDKLFNHEQKFPMDVLDQEVLYKQLSEIYKSSNINTSTNIHDPKFLIPAGYHGNELSSTLNDIHEIVDICKQNHIDLKIFINPIHNTTFNATNKILFSEFKHSLATITDYYDFSGPNSITSNNLYWSDTTHYDLQIGEYILQSLYHYGHPPKDFGFYVPKINP
jgi:hypothetical protein